MPRWLKISLKLTGIFIGALLLIWLGLAWYITSHKKELLKNITAQLNKNIQGTLTIKDMHPSFLFSLPYFSVSLDDISLRDSLWSEHHHDLLKAEKIYVQINPISLLKRKPRIHEVTIQNGSIYLFTDSTGYSNLYMLQRKDTTTIRHKSEATFQKLELENVQFVYENKVKNKLFKITTREAVCKMKFHNTGWDLKARLKTHIYEFNFNTDKGSFLKDENLRATLNMNYLYSTKMLEIPAQLIYINEQPIVLKGNMSFAQDVPTFALDFNTHDIDFAEAKAIVAPNIGRHFDSFGMKKPVDVHAYIQGRMQYRDTPLVQVSWHVVNNTFYTPVGTFNNCSMTGWFNNEVIKGMGHSDANSEIMLSHIKATWARIPLTADTVHVTDLKHPILFCHIKSNFPVQGLNTITGGETFRFDTGKAQADLVYKGSIDENDTVQPYLNGYMRIENAGITYMPRNLSFTKCNAQLDFNGNDLLIKNVQVKSRQSILYMDGHISNFLSMYFNSPDKMVLNWNINSPIINLNEFKSFLGKRRRASNFFRKYQRVHIANKLDDILDACSVNMQVHVDKLLYKKFDAQNISATVWLANGGVTFENVWLEHAGGSLNANGYVEQEDGHRTFSIDAQIDKVKIDQLFYSFDNFGQDAIDKDNIKGLLTAQIHMKGLMNDDARIVHNSLYGTIKFNLNDGELVHFEPLEKIGKFVFKKRNLSYITFGDLNNTFNIDHDKIIINPMLVTSSAINFKMQGIYSPPTKTNIQLEVPLRNPKNVDDTVQNWDKGIVLYLVARDDEQGKLKIGWDRSRGFMRKHKHKKLLQGLFKKRNDN